MAVARFWREADARYNLIGTKCTICGEHFFPGRVMCTKCHRESIGKMEKSKLSGKGEVLSFSLVNDGFGAMKMQSPYIIAIIKLEEGPQITSQIVDSEPEDIDIGTKVRSVFRLIRADGKAGIIHYGYKFMKDLPDLDSG